MKLKNIYDFFSHSRLRNFFSKRKETDSIIANPVINEGSMAGWSDLPFEILHCLASRLELVDQIRFRAVCRSWSKIQEVKPNDKLPWIFVLNESRFEIINNKSREPHYYLYNLQHQKSYRVSIRQWTTRMHLFGLESMHIICIKLGWLLLNTFFRNSFILFNLFTQKLIALPQVFKSHVCTLATFRYCTKSKRLIVYATVEDVVNGIVIIKRWESGDRRWESCNFVAEFSSFMKKIIKIEVVGEAVYCIFDTGVVGCFNECHKSWSVIVKYNAEEKFIFTVKNWFSTFEFRGELLTMDFGTFSKCHIWRLDQSKGRWVKVDQFHKCAIFCSFFEPYSAVCSEQFAVASDLATVRIYYFKTLYTGVSTKDYNDARRRSDDFDPFHIMNVQFPWCDGKNPFYWIEPFQ